MGVKKEMAGQKCGRLTVLYECTKRKRRHAYWVCRCDCGNEKTVSGVRLRSGKTKSCGCFRSELSRERLLKPNGSKRKTTNGYIVIKHNDIWLSEHVHIMQESIRRSLKKGEVVHHKNEDKTDNSIGNLQLMTESEHKSYHGNKDRGIKLNANKVLKIKELIKDGDLTKRKIAELYSVSATTITNIDRNIIWRNV